MKFLRTLLLPLLSILLASGNQVLSNLDNPLLGVSSNVKHTAKTGENAEVWSKQGKGSKITGNVGAAPLKVGDYTFSETAASHFNKITKKSGWYNGQPSRPYMSSPLSIQEIISSGKGVPDKFLKGGIKYNVPGEFCGNKGMWELVLHPKEQKIYHFLFKPSK
jgi:hypothetical protein